MYSSVQYKKHLIVCKNLFVPNTKEGRTAINLKLNLYCSVYLSLTLYNSKFKTKSEYLIMHKNFFKKPFHHVTKQD